ncbi:MAG: translocation/assembly module TamB domain-containing protein, partial [Deltaproteobacteria bacterium]|nr:translocation/assembly module TamB domain-containing protein [Deltaproteobacteria bacterium]
MRRWLTIVLLILLVCAGLAGLGLYALAHWNWGGPYLLSLLQARVNGKVTAGGISGNPFTGITYQDFAIETHDKQVFLKADAANLRLSVESFFVGHLVLSDVGLVQPLIHAVEVSGHWNTEKLLKTQPPVTKAPSLTERIKAAFLRKVDLTKVTIKQGEILLIRDGVLTDWRDLNFESDLTLIEPGEPKQEIQVKRAEFGVATPQGPVHFTAKLRYSVRVVKVDQFELKMAGKTVLSLQGDLCQPAAGLSCKATGYLGPVKASLIREFWNNWPAEWDLAGKFAYQGTPNGARLQTTGDIGQARFDLQGEFDSKAKPATFSLKGSLQNLTIEQFKEVRGLQVAKFKGLSPVNARLELKGTGLPWNPETMDGALNLEPFRYKDVKVGKLFVTLKGDAERQDFKGLAEGNFGKVEAASKGHLLPLGKDGKEIRGELTLRTQNFQPALLGLKQYAGTDLTSSYTGRFRLPPGYSASQLYLAGDLTANGRVYNEPLKSLQAKFVLNQERLEIDRAEMRLAAGDAAVKGTISRSGANLSFTAAVTSSRNLPVKTGGSFSALTARGTIRGPWRSLQINLTAQARQLSFNGVAVQSASLKADIIGLPPQAGNLVLQGTDLQTKLGTFSRFNLNAQGQGGGWDFNLAATSAKYPRLELAGSANLRGRPLSFDIRQVSWQSQDLNIKNKAPFQVRILPGYEISPATFQVDGGTVAVQATARGNELAGRLEIQNLDTTLVQPSGYEMKGKLNGKATLSGTPRAPMINGKFNLVSAEIQQINIKTLTTNISYNSGNLQLSGYLEAGSQPSRLTWKGTVPLTFSITPWQFALGNQGLDLQVRSEKINLSLLKTLTPEIQSAEGQVDMMVSAKGDPHRPQLTGSIRWGAGSVQPRQAGLVYRLNPGEARLQGDKIVIPAITMESQGTITVSGNLNLKGASAVETRLQGFQVMSRGGNQIWLDGEVYVSGPVSHLVVKGRITVPKALLRPTLFSGGLDPDVVLVDKPPAKKKTSAKPSPYQNMQIDLPITSHGNVRLKDPQGQAELAIALRATKKAGQELAVGGTIRA